MHKLQWGKRKWMRRMKMKDSSLNGKSDRGGEGGGGGGDAARVADDNGNNHSSKERHNLPPPVTSSHIPNSMELWKGRSIANDNQKAKSLSLPDREGRYHTKRGSQGFNENSKVSAKEENRKIVWPRLLVSLSSKEKEEDFMLMKGCKPSQRPKKRAKMIQRTILLVSPGAWLSDVCQERYEVREKKASKKKPRGLRAMGSMGIDSE